MEEVKVARLASDWKQFEDSEFWVEFVKLIKTENTRIYKALAVPSNDRDKDMQLKGELKSIELVQRKLKELVNSLGMKTG